jgi:hypothetical protein
MRTLIGAKNRHLKHCRSAQPTSLWVIRVISGAGLDFRFTTISDLIAALLCPKERARPADWGVIFFPTSRQA